MKTNDSTWAHDPVLVKWQAKHSELSSQLSEAESKQTRLASEITEAEDNLVQTRCSVLLGEAAAQDVSQGEAGLTDLCQQQTAITREIEALRVALARTQQEARDAEAAAKKKAVDRILPEYREKIHAVQSALERAIEANEALKGFETEIAKQGFSQEHRAFRQPHHVVGISFPLGLKDWVASTQIVMKEG